VAGATIFGKMLSWTFLHFSHTLNFTHVSQIMKLMWYSIMLCCKPKIRFYLSIGAIAAIPFFSIWRLLLVGHLKLLSQVEGSLQEE
jgi:hypothetical protein